MNIRNLFPKSKEYFKIISLEEKYNDEWKELESIDSKIESIIKQIEVFLNCLKYIDEVSALPYIKQLADLEDEYKRETINSNNSINMYQNSIENLQSKYILKLEKLLSELKIKSITIDFKTITDNLDLKDIECLIVYFMKIKKNYLDNIDLCTEEEIKKYNKKFIELSYILIKKEYFTKIDNKEDNFYNTIYNTLNKEERLSILRIYLKDIYDTYNNYDFDTYRYYINKIIKCLDNKINLSFSLDLLYYFAPLDMKRIGIPPRLRSTRITPERFKEIYDINPFPYNKEDNEKLRKMDISSINYDNCDIRNCDFSYTNINFNPQKLNPKSVEGVNFEGVNLRNLNFDDIYVGRANFNFSGVKINLQKIKWKTISHSSFLGIDMSNQDFTNVGYSGSNLSYTGAKPQFSGGLWMNPEITNLRCLDLSDYNFDDMYINRMNLSFTNASIDPETLYPRNCSIYYFGESDLRGLNLNGKDFTRVMDIEQIIFDEGFKPFIKEKEHQKLLRYYMDDDWD